VLLAFAVDAPEARAQRVAVAVHGGYGHPAHYGYARPAVYGSWYAGYPWYYGFGVSFGYPYGGYPYYASPYAYAPYPYYVDNSASMRLEVKPRETEVYVDGYFAGTVDDFDGQFQRLNIEPGQHEIQLYLAGHRTFVQQMYLQLGKTTRIRHMMEPLAPGEPDAPKPTGNPGNPDRNITPSAPRSNSPSAPSRRPSAIPPSSRNDDSGGISIGTPSTDSYGSIALRVQPGPATVLIDGERWEGPQADERFVVQLPSGRHIVEIQKDGFRRYTTEVTVHSGETAALNVALTRNP
jgi:hypothetical protein